MEGDVNPEEFSRFELVFDDGAVAGFRYPNAGAPPLMFCHANGFCASAYKRMLAGLADRFDVFAIDLRGHGRTSLPAAPEKLKGWAIYGEDIGAALDRLRGEFSLTEPWRLSGHSMGAVSAALAARERTEIFALGLIEPVAMPPFVRFLAATPFWGSISSRMKMVRAARARRASWPDRESVLARYREKPVFKNWAPGVLEDYLEDGLVASADGACRLACDPQWEAANFASHAHDFWGAVKSGNAPIHVLAAHRQSTALISGARKRFEKYGARVDVAEAGGHLVAQEHPAVAADFLRACFAGGDL